MKYNFDKNLGEFLENEPMKNHTSFKVGGPCELFVRPKDEKSLIEILKIIRKNNYNFYILGNATNVIVKDQGYKGIIISIKNRLNDAKVDGLKITAGAGLSLKELSQTAYENSLSGLEFANGIPGTVGGAMTMNAGAYDGEMKNVVESVRFIDNHGNIRESSNEEMDFSYRHSKVGDENLIVLSATFVLEKGDKEKIREKFQDFDRRRKEKQPLDLPSAGSTFKRPEGYFAGKLIDDSGLRGFRHNGAGVSQKHCGFVVNYDNASASDVLETIEIVQKVVYDKFSVKLEREVKIIG